MLVLRMKLLPCPAEKNLPRLKVNLARLLLTLTLLWVLRLMTLSTRQASRPSPGRPVQGPGRLALVG